MIEIMLIYPLRQVPITYKYSIIIILFEPNITVTNHAESDDNIKYKKKLASTIAIIIYKLNHFEHKPIHRNVL